MRNISLTLQFTYKCLPLAFFSCRINTDLWFGRVQSRVGRYTGHRMVKKELQGGGKQEDYGELVWERKMLETMLCCDDT